MGGGGGGRGLRKKIRISKQYLFKKSKDSDV
jgi:hypothetical protein